MHTKNFTLSNGLKVAIYSAPQFQTVGIAVGVRYGSVDENPRVNGAAHYLEHMLFKGTKKRSWKQISEEARNFGMMQNAFTDKETTTYFLGVYRGYFKRAVNLISDMIKNSTFPEKEFELERGPIINENLMRSDIPIYMFYDFLPKVLYKKHPARMPIGGDDATIKRTKRGDILNIYQNYYNPGNMILSIYGGVETRKALSIIKEHFADFHKKSKTPSRTDATESQVRKEITINKKGIKQTRLGIGFKSMGFRSVGIKEYLSMEVISEILSKRMFDEVREKRGLSYDPGASYSIYNTFGFIAAAAGIEPAKQDETKEVMLKEFEKMQNGEVDKSELSKRKQGLSVRYAIDKEDTLGMALSISDAHLTYGDTSIPERIPGLIKTVSLDDVRKYSSEYINVDKYGLVVLKPKK